jgi:hypothetical protein
MIEENLGVIFQKKMLSSDNEKKLKTLSILAHSITVEIRGLFITRNSLEKTALYSLNEIQHQITARIMNLLHNEDEWNEEEFVSTLYDYANEGDCKDGLDFAIRQTLNATRSKK